MNFYKLILFSLNRYISNPLLMNGHKFHLRVYVLCVGALRVFVFEKILILIAAHKYDLNDTDNIFSHLTNTARSAEDVHFDEKKFVKTLDDLPEYLIKEKPEIAKNKEDANKIITQIKDDIYKITNELFNAFENEYTVFSPMNNCFEIFGLDFMIDQDLQVSLLEVNPGPDFQQTGGKLKIVIEDLWEQTLEIVLDSNKNIQSKNGNKNESGDNNENENDNENNNNNDDNVDYSGNNEDLNNNANYNYLDKPTKDFTCVYAKQSSTSHLKGGMTFK